MARIQENALKKNPRLRILDIRIANSQPKILNQKMSPSNRIPSIQVQKFRRDPLPASYYCHPRIFRSSDGPVSVQLCFRTAHILQMQGCRNVKNIGGDKLMWKGII